MSANNVILEAVLAKARQADEAMLISMLEAVPAKAEPLSLSVTELAEMKERVRRYESGEVTTSTWDEVMDRIAQRRRSNGVV